MELRDPYTSHRPAEYAHYTERFTGRAAPVSAALGTPAPFWTDDAGVYLTNLRDVQPCSVRECGPEEGIELLLEACREHTVVLSDSRLDLPREPPHVMEHNLGSGSRRARPC
jgi:hypothetical protein